MNLEAHTYTYRQRKRSIIKENARKGLSTIIILQTIVWIDVVLSISLRDGFVSFICSRNFRVSQ